MADLLAQFAADHELWTRAVYRAAAEGVAAAMGALEADAKGTGIYADDTGATRGSTVGYVVSGDGQIDEEGRANAAFSVAEHRNPGSATDDYEDVGAQEVVGILTVFTVYALDLETSRGGFIGPTMDGGAPQLHNAAMAAIAQVV